MVLKDRNKAIKFFIKTLKAAFHLKAIDSMRPRYTNAHLVLREIKFLCEEIDTGNVKFWHLEQLIEEAKKILEKDVLLEIRHTQKRDNIIKQLNTCKGKRNKVIYLKSYIEVELGFFKKNYKKQLIDEILKYCDLRTPIKLTFKVKSDVRGLAYALVSEFIHDGVSFAYLRHKIGELKLSSGKTEMKKFFYRLQRKYKFRCCLILSTIDRRVVKFMKEEMHNRKIQILEKIPTVPLQTNKFNSFKSASEGNTLIFYDNSYEAHDSFSALFGLQSRIEPIAHYIHLNFPDRDIDFFNFGLVYDPSVKEWFVLNYKDIVHFEYTYRYKKFRRNLEVYLKLAFQVEDSEISQKIGSSMAHLSFSYNERNSLNSYLNSWIAFEVLFNCLKRFDKSGRRENTFDLISEYVPVISSLFYLPKLVTDFGKDLERLMHQGAIASEFYKKFVDKSANGRLSKLKLMKALRDKDELKELLDVLKDYPYEAHKAEYLSRNMEDGKKIKNCINGHQNNIEHHLRRLYRIRNDLVHNAATINDERLLNLTSLALLCFNVQEYGNDVIDKILFYNKVCKPKNLTDVFEGFKSISDRMYLRLSEDKFTLEQILNPLEN